MAVNCSELNPILQEWAPLTDFLNIIPTKVQVGLFTHDVALTCVDVLPEFIAVGTNLGIVYWYDRKKKDLQRLRCENQNAKVTTIRIISTVDYMVACGNIEGEISIFQIPKSPPAGLPASLKPRGAPVQRYTVSQLHMAPVTCLEWAKNGMKLFSGDKNGVVVITEIDFYMHLSKSVEILNEAYEVVQLSYCQQYLLVSTTYRTIVCQKQDKWKVCQVGKKDRKSLGNYGGIFLRNGLKPKDISIYCSRPGLRIWISDLEGTVQQTLLFKDLLNKECFEVPLINPISSQAKRLRPQKEACFGPVLALCDRLLVTHSQQVVYVLDPASLLVIATISHLRNVVGLATCQQELFVLEGDKSLIRISFKPEAQGDDLSNNVASGSPFLPLANSIKDLTSKLNTSSIISAIPPLFDINSDYNVQTDLTSIINAEEAYESPKKKDKQKSPSNTQDISPGTECIDIKKQNQKKFEVFEKIGTQEFDDDILFKHHKKKKPKEQKNTENKQKNTENNEQDANESPNLAQNPDTTNTQINRPSLLNISTIGSIAPDLRSPDSILSDIETKEKILADLLNLDKITFDLSETNLNKNTDSKINKTQKTNQLPLSTQNHTDSKINRTKNIQMFSSTKHVSDSKTNIRDSKINKPQNSQTFSSTQNISNSINKMEVANNDPKIKLTQNVQLPSSIQYLDSKTMIETAQNYGELSKSGTNVMGAQKNNILSMKNNMVLNSETRSNLKSEDLKTNSERDDTVLSYGPPSGSSQLNCIEPPACLTIPNVWKLQELTINAEANEASDSSLHDWEII